MDSPGVDVTATALGGGALVAIAYSDQSRAAEVLAAMKRLQKDGALHLNDAVAVAKNEDGDGRIKVDWDVSRTVAGAAGGLILGTLVGLVFLSPVTSGLTFLSPATGGLVFLWPVIGALFGATAGGLAGTFADTEHIDDFVLEVRDTMPSGSSAILMLVEQVDPGPMLAKLRLFGGTVIRTTLPEDAEARLRAALSQPPIGAANGAHRVRLARFNILLDSDNAP